MSYFTASEARTAADSSKRVERLVKSLLRDIKRAAKRGEYHFSIRYSDYDEKLANKVCDRLGKLGYTAHADGWCSAIYISW